MLHTYLVIYQDGRNVILDWESNSIMAGSTPTIFGTPKAKAKPDTSHQSPKYHVPVSDISVITLRIKAQSFMTVSYM